MSRERPSGPIKYGDVFNVSGQLASHAIAPKDAAALSAEENAVLGHKGIPAALMQSAADLNEQCGVVDHQDMTDIVRDRGVAVAEAESGGYRVAIGGQVIGRYGQSEDEKMAEPTSAGEFRH